MRSDLRDLDICKAEYSGYPQSFGFSLLNTEHFHVQFILVKTTEKVKRNKTQRRLWGKQGSYGWQLLFRRLSCTHLSSITFWGTKEMNDRMTYLEQICCCDLTPFGLPKSMSNSL